MPRRPIAEPGFQDPLSYAVADRDRHVVRMVREALEAGEVLLAFQPVIGISGSTAFHEGLIRVLDGQGRVIPADRFIDAVETSDVGREIDCAALRCGLSALSRHPGLRLAINMSARSIGYPRWTDTLRRGLAADATLGERLILEITERSAMLVPELVGTFMAKLQVEGVAFALDDFGAAQTSFRHLKGFLFDIVKIDAGFVRDCDTDADNQCIVAALIAVARHFDMFTVAEGVESAAEAAFLADAGIDCLQGFHYGAPEVRPDWYIPPGAAARRTG